MLKLITTIVLIFTSLTVYADFVQDHDLISLHYDHAPDRDDGHATVSALAVVRALDITPHVVSGTYGIHNSDGYQPSAVDVMHAAWGSAWLDAHANWQSAVNNTAQRWHNTLANGGDIWVAEGGQSDFTSDVLRSIRSTYPDIDTNSRIHVVQHSVWNEEMSNQTDLDYSRANTNYIMIADGNGANTTADLNEKSNRFVVMARASEFGDAWNAAFSYLEPNMKLDFSDTVELLHILDIGLNQVATVDDFSAVFLDSTPTSLATSPTAWSDSYSVNGQCYCDTSFDHGLDSISVDTPAGSRSVQQVCADITSTFGTGSFENRIYFNTVQCGHEPANNAADETICPGIPRALNDYTGSRCNQTGATWNLDALYKPADNTAPSISIGTPITDNTVISTGSYNFSGTASDTGGSGFYDVRFAIRNRTLAKWYNFSNDSFNGANGNGAVSASLTSTSVGSTNWNKSVSLPSGDYVVAVRTLDNAGNASAWSYRAVTIRAEDTQTPTISINNPANDKAVLPPGFVTISGTASDTGGSGFYGVRFAIRNLTLAKWYNFSNNSFNGANGNGAVSANLISASASSTDWNKSVSLPAGDYVVAVRTLDNAGNASAWSYRAVTIRTPDTQTPTISISNPANDRAVLPPGFATISGTASDTGGSGFYDVRFAIRNRTLAKWYNFSDNSFNGANGNGAVSASLTGTAASFTNWNKSVSLPAGDYVVAVRALDNAGNASAWSYRTLTIRTP